MNRRSPRRPMYDACTTKPPGSSRSTPKFHSCTVGKYICGSKTVIGGATPLNCCGGVKNDEGFALGAGNWVGNPPATVLLRSAVNTHPLVIELNEFELVENEDVHVCTRPGTLPAAAVTWNDEIVSNAIP